MTLHPTPEKALVFAGDKLGSLGIFDSSQDVPEDDEDWVPQITHLKLHARTISALQCSPHDANSVFSASYDSSIRRFDLEKGVAVEAYAPANGGDEGISHLQLVQSEPHLVYFSTLEGRMGIHDFRTPPTKSSTKLYQLSEKKIGGFSVHPLHPHLCVTASLDRTVKLWDLRKITGSGDDKLPFLVGEHESRLSVSNAAFNAAGQVATASYDDTIKIYDFSSLTSSMLSKPVGTTLSDAAMQPSAVIRHNNQTGRWVTILKPVWQAQPQDGVQKLCIGNMNRFVDIYSADGQQLAQLGGEGISAVPAVATWHPRHDWVAAGTASGKLCLWM